MDANNINLVRTKFNVSSEYEKNQIKTIIIIDHIN